LLRLRRVEEAGGGETVSVHGYYRKDGTYVRPHTRTAPDGNSYNNSSYPGNYNPNTGTITPGDPAKDIERYYNRSAGTPSALSSSSASLAPTQAPQQSTRSASYWDAYERGLKIYCEQAMRQAVSQCVREDLERQDDTQAQHRAIKYKQPQKLAAIPQKREPSKQGVYSSHNTLLFEQAQRDYFYARGSTSEDSCIKSRMESIKNIEGMKTTNR
jgi:hypothetical protein